MLYTPHTAPFNYQATYNDVRCQEQSFTLRQDPRSHLYAKYLRPRKSIYAARQQRSYFSRPFSTLGVGKNTTMGIGVKGSR